MHLDYVMVGKGPSASTFNWLRLLEPYPLIAINEAITLVPPEYPATVNGIVQDWDPIRRLIATQFRAPNQMIVPTDYVDAARKERPDLFWGAFRLCDVPKGSTACVAMHFMRRWTDGDKRLRVGCIGFDAYFGGSWAYDPAFAQTLKEPISRKGDYDIVNGQIAKCAKDLNVDLIDLPAVVGA